MRELNAMPTSTDMPTFQPFDVWPLYASPPSAPEEREDERRLDALMLLATDEVFARFAEDGVTVKLSVLTNDIWAPAGCSDDLSPEEYGPALAAWRANRHTGLLRFIAQREGYPLHNWRGKTFDEMDAIDAARHGTEEGT